MEKSDILDFEVMQHRGPQVSTLEPQVWMLNSKWPLVLFDYGSTLIS